MAADTGSPYLGGHVIGQRIVVRRLVPGEAGPTGGPAFVDVLGECVAWDPCVVLTATGERVTIPLDLIVSGKPVPPRPSVRLRASVAECEAQVAGLWPAVEVTDLAGWSLRYSPTVDRRRANSCLAVVPPSCPLVTALDGVIAHYTALGRPPLVAVERDGDLEATIRAAGWVLVPGDAAFLMAATSKVLRSLRLDADPVVVTTDGVHAYATTDLGAGPVARGRAALQGDWLGLHELAVDPAHRRQGHGRAVLAALVAWGAEQGARTAWLHVEDDNDAALALYGGVGFLEHHRMRYLAPAR